MAEALPVSSSSIHFAKGLSEPVVDCGSPVAHAYHAGNPQNLMQT
jgi:hypothetical protein